MKPSKTQMDIQTIRVRNIVKDHAVFEDSKMATKFRKEWDSLTNMIDSLFDQESK